MMHLHLGHFQQCKVALVCLVLTLSILTYDVGLTFSRNTIPFVFEIVKSLGPLRRSLKVQCVFS